MAFLQQRSFPRPRRAAGPSWPALDDKFKRHTCPETGCNTNFKRKSDLERHRKAVHSRSPSLGDDYIYRCRVAGCNIERTRPDHFVKHAKPEHPDLNTERLVQEYVSRLLVTFVRLTVYQICVSLLWTCVALFSLISCTRPAWVSPKKHVETTRNCGLAITRFIHFLFPPHTIHLANHQDQYHRASPFTLVLRIGSSSHAPRQATPIQRKPASPPTSGARAQTDRA